MPKAVVPLNFAYIADFEPCEEGSCAQLNSNISFIKAKGSFCII